MNDVKVNSLDLASRAGSTASLPQQNSQQAAKVSGAADNSAQGINSSVSVGQIGAEKSSQSQEQKDKQLEGAVTKLNDYIQNVQRDLEFQTDDSSGKTVITVVDRQTSEVVRQIPDDVALKLAQDLQQDEPLSLFNIKV
ncbi:flagellar protein FlaG [Alkalimarinus sediminis]|uniref:Flagellar protein FlaG n=1 Tax=Alkalimarinus sediminis TaxID=1632866 RepID=A0A9E8KQF6_9ALTE|nr:flagellar protein FlaG [Alkalimarinus sediminis]UZW75784.1 flagellar protein FlaG [Alkalimarinus sediminis]